MTSLARLDVVAKLPNEFAEPLTILPWWHEFFAALDDDAHHELLLVLKRQTGKSQLMAAAAVSELFKPNAYVLLVAASQAQQQAVFNRKIRKPLMAMLTPAQRKQFGATFTASGVRFDALGSELEVISSSEFTSPGRTPTLVCIDEARDVADGVYTSLAPSVLGSGGKLVIASTTGRPTGWFFTLVSNPAPETWLYRSTTNDNPRAKRGLLSFIERRLALVSPAAARRELGGEFTDDGDELLPTKLIDSAVDDTLGEIAVSDLPGYGFLDLSRKHDLTSLVVVLRADARRPEAGDHLVCASVQTWNPKDSPTGEVDFGEVRAALAMLPQRFTGLEKILVDEGAEAGSVLPFCRSHSRLSLIVDGFIATPKSNQEMWSALVGRLNGRTLSIPQHERLIAELRGLRRQEFALGASWRVVDSSRRLHRDTSLALAGAVFASGSADDAMPLMLMGGSAYREWEAAHHVPVAAAEPVEDYGSGLKEHAQAEHIRSARFALGLAAASESPAEDDIVAHDPVVATSALGAVYAHARQKWAALRAARVERQEAKQQRQSAAQPVAPAQTPKKFVPKTAVERIIARRGAFFPRDLR